MNFASEEIIAQPRNFRSRLPPRGTVSDCRCATEISLSCWQACRQNYSFNRFLTFTSILQMDTSNTQAASANLRLRYNYRPDSDLYIIYKRGNAVRQHRSGKSSASTRDALRGQMDVFVRSVEVLAPSTISAKCRCDTSESGFMVTAVYLDQRWWV